MKTPVSGDDQTVALFAVEIAQVTLTRYRLREAAHQIISSCERLLGELEGPARDVWRDTIGKALLAGQHIRSLIEQRGALNSDEAGKTAMEGLLASISRPRETIVHAMSSLLAFIPTNLREELIMQDARRIRDAAIAMHTVAGKDATETGATPKAAPAHAGAPPAANGKVLVVDDNDALRKQLARMLGRLGYDVTLAQDGREALEQVEREMPDVIITDISMPEMTGHELLARLKANELTQHIPVIVVSGEDDAESVVKCLQQGAEDHLAKPYQPMVLQARLRSSLERKRMRDVEIAYLQRVARLTSAAEAVELQSYESGMVADLILEGDALGKLARVFDRMLNGMRAREEQLESRLRELRHEIRRASTETPQIEIIVEREGLSPGELFADRYEIKDELGRGGMGVVYLARDRELSEDVAVKIVRTDVIGRDPNLIGRLKSEIRLARKISHPNVVRSHDLGEWNGVYFLTMEYIKGIAVSDLIRTRGRLSVDSTLAIGTQLADALSVAHGADIIHRDIKPANLLVDQDGALKVTDFGLARPVNKAEAFTLEGNIVGTPKYMAPEQLLGGTIDARTDLFAAGVVLYECLTGAIPYDATSPIGILARMMDGAPTPVRDLNTEVPVGLASAVERLLHTEPEQRFRSARELADHLALVG